MPRYDSASSSSSLSRVIRRQDEQRERLRPDQAQIIREKEDFVKIHVDPLRRRVEETRERERRYSRGSGGSVVSYDSRDVIEDDYRRHGGGRRRERVAEETGVRTKLGRIFGGHQLGGVFGGRRKEERYVEEDDRTVVVGKHGRRFEEDDQRIVVERRDPRGGRVYEEQDRERIEVTGGRGHRRRRRSFSSSGSSGGVRREEEIKVDVKSKHGGQTKTKEIEVEKKIEIKGGSQSRKLEVDIEKETKVVSTLVKAPPEHRSSIVERIIAPAIVTDNFALTRKEPIREIVKYEREVIPPRHTGLPSRHERVRETFPPRVEPGWGSDNYRSPGYGSDPGGLGRRVEREVEVVERYGSLPGRPRRRSWDRTRESDAEEWRRERDDWERVPRREREREREEWRREEWPRWGEWPRWEEWRGDERYRGHERWGSERYDRFVEPRYVDPRSLVSSCFSLSSDVMESRREEIEER